MTQTQTHTPRSAAADWLTAALADGPVAVADVLAAASQHGHSEKTLRRAKQELGVLSVRLGQSWAWQLGTAESAAAVAETESPAEWLGRVLELGARPLYVLLTAGQRLGYTERQLREARWELGAAEWHGGRGRGLMWGQDWPAEGVPRLLADMPGPDWLRAVLADGPMPLGTLADMWTETHRGPRPRWPEWVAVELDRAAGGPVVRIRTAEELDQLRAEAAAEREAREAANAAAERRAAQEAREAAEAEYRERYPSDQYALRSHGLGHAARYTVAMATPQGGWVTLATYNTREPAEEHRRSLIDATRPK